MFAIQTYNSIAPEGLARLPSSDFTVGPEVSDADAILLRSHKLHEQPLPQNLLAIGRAGAGVNNIPLAQMNERGVVVFNAPGANANAVKELVIASMLMACRNLPQAWNYTRNLTDHGSELASKVELGKKEYVGIELPGRTLAVVGLGAIGVKVANAAVSLGMNVLGYDPSISVKSAWNLSSSVVACTDIEMLVQHCDFISFHVPLIDATRDLLNADRIAKMRAGAVVLNFAREGIVDDEAVVQALNQGRLHSFVTDFPSAELRGHPRVISLPHLGASTYEAEQNCAVMVADQLKEFLQNGNITNSVNFPEVNLSRSSEFRLSITHKNRPDMVGQISHELGQGGINISHLLNESRGDLAYTLMDLDKSLDAAQLSQLQQIEGVLQARNL